MNHDNYRRLLRELLPGEETSELRARTMEEMLSLARRRREGRQAVRRLALTVVPVLCVAAIIAVLYGFVFTSGSRRVLSPSPTASTKAQGAARPAALPSKVRILTDDELLAMFPGRPAALIRRGGEMEFVLLDTVRGIGERRKLSLP
jgi:hypothetical protein